MVRRGKVISKRSFRKRVRSKERRSDDSDEDYVVSDEGRDVSDCSEEYCTSLDGCASEEGFDSFIEEEDEEEEEIEEVKNFNRSKPENGICRQQKNGSKTLERRGRTTYAEQLEEEGDGDWNDDEDEDEDFDYDDEEFTPEEEELRGRKKKNSSMRVGKKILQKRVSVTSKKSRKKRRRSRAVRKPLRKRRRKNGGLRSKVRCDDDGDFLYSRPASRTKSRKKPGRKKRRLLADSDCVSSGSSDYEYTISEEEREQVREAEELCGRLRTNLRGSLLLTKNEEVGFYRDLHRQRKPQGQKGKEKIEEPEGKKGKEKVDDLKSDVGKQVCGICLSEEDKRRVRGVLNCCTHYFCFACIMEWAKVESRCPLCKQRFKTINKRARSTCLREVVVQVPKRDQVYQPSEEELRSYTDPYEYVICSECHQGGDDGLMLLCDFCDSPAHTYCVGLGREVPEGNWYCDGCRPAALGSSCSQVQEHVADSREAFQSLPGRPSPFVHVQESIDLNLLSSPFSQEFGNLSSRFSGRSVDGASLVSGGGAPTLSERRRIHNQIQQLLSNYRMNSTTGGTNGILATSSTSNLHSFQIDSSRETATQHTRTQDVGTSYHTSSDKRLGNNTSPLMQSGDLLSMRISNSRRPVVQDSTAITDRPVTVNGALWPGLLTTPLISDYEQVHQFHSRSNTVTNDIMFSAVREEGKFQSAKEQLQLMVKSHLKSLSKDIDIGHSTFKDIARSSTHTILAACGLEHRKSEVCIVPSPSVCPHMELMAGGRTSLIKGCCSSCFDSFVGDVVKRIMDTRMPQWLRLGL